jgi:hypothetical protein
MLVAVFASVSLVIASTAIAVSALGSLLRASALLLPLVTTFVDFGFVSVALLVGWRTLCASALTLFAELVASIDATCCVWLDTTLPPCWDFRSLSAAIATFGYPRPQTAAIACLSSVFRCLWECVNFVSLLSLLRALGELVLFLLASIDVSRVAPIPYGRRCVCRSFLRP